MNHNRPWSSEMRSLETPKVSRHIYLMKEHNFTKLFLATDYKDFKNMIFGLAALIELPMEIFYLAPSAKPKDIVHNITTPLHSGKKVLLASESHTSLLSEILEAWEDFTRVPQNYRRLTKLGLLLDSGSLQAQPSILIALHTAQPQGPLGYQLARIPKDEASTLEFIGQLAKKKMNIIE